MKGGGQDLQAIWKKSEVDTKFELKIGKRQLDNKDTFLLGYDAVPIGNRILKFRRNVLFSSSRTYPPWNMNTKLSKHASIPFSFDTTIYP